MTFTEVRHRYSCEADDEALMLHIGTNGRRMTRCQECGWDAPEHLIAGPRPQRRAEPSPKREVAEPPADPSGRYFLACCRCGVGMWPASSKPRVPLCGRCRTKPKRNDDRQETAA